MQREIPALSTFGKEQPLMQLTELLRGEVKDYTESLTWALCSRAENFGYLRQPDSSTAAVSIGNPATTEFEVCRTQLLTGQSCRLSSRPASFSVTRQHILIASVCLLIQSLVLVTEKSNSVHSLPRVSFCQ